MTDKQIIIDITGCKYSTFGGGCTMLKTCHNNPNCYYKQLKRAEAQCEGMFVTHTDLEMKYKAKEDLINEIEDIVKPYQTEIEAEAFSLPTAIKSILERKEQECENNKIAYQMELDIYNQECLNLQEELKTKEQKLEKIKEIVNTHKQNKCKACSEFDNCLGHPYCDEVILKIIEE